MSRSPKTRLKAFFVKMCLLSLWLVSAPWSEVQAQGCECVGPNCNGLITGSSSQTFILNIAGSTNNNLSNSGQGVCGIYLDFQNNFIYQLEVLLTSPSGQTITLIGPSGNSTNFPHFGAYWKLGFLPCAEAVAPDIISGTGLPYTEQWYNFQEWAASNASAPYDGTYYPNSGCLEDFTGSVNGDWTITVNNNSFGYNVDFFGFSIEFCDDSGLGCSDCTPDAGSLFFVPDFDHCQGATTSTTNYTPTYSGSPPSADYSYTYIVSSNNVITTYNDLTDLSGFAVGTYEVCGLSYRTIDAGLIPSPDGTMSTADLNNQLVNNGIFCGEISADCFTINVAATPNAVVGNNMTIDCNNTTATLSGAGSSDGIEFSHQWIPSNGGNIVSGATTLMPVVDAAGDYELVVTNINSNCSASATVMVTVDTIPPSANAGSDTLINCYNNSIVLESIGTPDPNFFYNWTNVVGNFVGNPAASSVEIDAAGNYQLTVTNPNNGCTAIDEVVVTENFSPAIADAGDDQSLVCGVTSISLGGTNTSQGTEYQYLWTATNGGNITSDATAENAIIDAAGNYQLLVTNTISGCTDSDEVSVTGNVTLPTVVVGNDITINCNNTTATLSGVGSSDGIDFTHQWIPSNGGNIVSGETTLMPVVDAAGDYELIVTNTTSNCSASATVMVTVDTIPPSANAGSDTLINCYNNSIILEFIGTPDPNFFYNWTTIGGNFVGNPAATSVEIDAAGTYQLTVTNPNNGCTAIDEVVVTENFSPAIADAGDNRSLVCGVTSISLGGTNTSQGAEYQYLWTATNGGNIASGATSENAIIDAAGNYQLLVTNTISGCTDTGEVSVTGNVTLPTIVVGNDMTINCNNTTATLSGVGSSDGIEFSHQWIPSNGGNIVSGATTLMPVVDAAGDYELVVTNTNSNCSASATVMVTVDTIPPSANAGSDTLINCYNNSIILEFIGTPDPNFFYNWTTIGGNFVGNPAASSVEIDAAGTYQLTVTNPNNGCTAIDEVVVTENFTPAIADAGTNESLVCGVTSISLGGTNTSQGTEYQYLWTATNGGNITSGANTENATVNSVGDYQLLVTNTISGCTQLDEVNVSGNTDLPTVVVGNDMTIDCNNTTATLSGAGSSDGIEFSHQWIPSNGGNIVSGETTLMPVVDAAGDYELIVTNTNSNCSASGTVSVTVDTLPPTADAGDPMFINCLTATPTLDGSNSSSTDHAYQWTTDDGSFISGEITLTPQVNSIGTYVITVLDNSNGCTATDEVLVSTDTISPLVEAGNDTMLTCSMTEIELEGNFLSGNNFTYEWSTTTGNFISPTNANTVLVDAPSTYTLTVTNILNGCTSSDSLVVTQDAALPLVDVGEANIIPCATHQLTLDGTNSSMSSEFTYLWTTTNGSFVSGENTLTPTVDSVGLYLLTITNTITNCSASSPLTVTLQNCNLVAEAGNSATIGCGSTTTNLNGTGSSTGIEIIYEWTTQNGTIISGENTLMPTVDGIGMYVLTVQDTLTGAVAQDSVQVTASSDLPIAMANANGFLSCTDTTVFLMGTGSSIGSNMVYNWSTIDGNIVAVIGGSNVLVNEVGWYYLEITNSANGCIAIDSIEVLQDTSLPFADAGIDTVLNCSSNVISLDAKNSSTGPNVIYSWETLDGNILLGETTLTPTIDSIGTYVLTVTDTINNCSITSSVEVAGDFTPPNSNAGSALELTCTDSILTLDGSLSSVGDEFNYNWQTTDGNILLGENTLQPTIDTEGLYELVIRDLSNGCLDTSEVLITSNFSAPTANAGLDLSLDCGIASIMLDGSNSTDIDVQYLWTTDNGTIISGEQTNLLEAGSAGTYTLTVQNNSNGCTDSDEVVLTPTNCTPIISILEPDTITCLQTQIVLDGSNSSDWASIIYEWTTDNGTIIGNANTAIITVASEGDYQLTITDQLTNMTTSTTIAVFDNNENPTAIAGLPDTLNCITPALTLNGNGSSEGNNFIYEWTALNGSAIDNALTLSPTVSAPDTYELIVTNTDNTCTSIAQVVIEIDTLSPTANAGIDLELTCDDPTFILDGSTSSIGNEYEYTWITDFGNILLGNNTPQPEIDGAGNYQLTVTNMLNGCTATDEAIVEIDTISPTINIATPLELNCTITTQNLDASNSSNGNNFTYQWTTQDGNILSGNQSFTPLIDEAGTYLFSIENNTNGCTNEEAIVISQDTIAPLAAAGLDVELNCVDTILTIDGSSSSKGGVFLYEWTTGTGNILSGENTISSEVDATGFYQLQVTNSNNTCTAIDLVEVTQNIETPTALIEPADDLNCEVQSIELDASNSSAGQNFNYSWSTIGGNIVSGNTTPDPIINEGGIYILTILNNENGCSEQANISIQQDTISPTANAGTTQTLNCVDPIFILNGNNSSQGMEFQYLWTTTNGNIVSGENELTPTIDAAGIYQLEVSNNNNKCTSINSVQINEDLATPVPTIDAIGGLVINCDVSSIVLDGSGTTPIGDVSFEWNTANGNFLSGQNLPNPEIDAKGNYTVVITNENNGCTTESNIAITENLIPPSISVTTPDILTCVDTIVTLSNEEPPVGSNFSFQWTTTDGNIISGENNFQSTINESGDYTLTIEDTTNGCSVDTTISVLQNVDHPMADAGGNYQFSCIEIELQLSAIASQGDEFTYQWTTPNGNIVVGNNTLTPTVDEDGIYSLAVTNSINGCISISETSVSEDMDTPQNATFNIVPPACNGESNASINIASVFGGDAPYEFSFNDSGSFSSFSEFLNLSAGNYPIAVRDASGCEWDTILVINDPAEVEVELGDDLYIELGDEIELEALTNIPMSDLVEVTWRSADTIPCNDCLVQDLSPLETTGYAVTVTNENGCVASDEVLIYVENKQHVFIPNVFTPDGDGQNDVFMIYGGNDVEEVEEFMIFNRWGELVFEQHHFQPNDATYGWDGRLKGQKMNSAVFIYFAKIKYINGKTGMLKGDLILK